MNQPSRSQFGSTKVAYHRDQTVSDAAAFEHLQHRPSRGSMRLAVVTHTEQFVPFITDHKSIYHVPCIGMLFSRRCNDRFRRRSGFYALGGSNETRSLYRKLARP